MLKNVIISNFIQKPVSVDDTEFKSVSILQEVAKLFGTSLLPEQPPPVDRKVQDLSASETELIANSVKKIISDLQLSRVSNLYKASVETSPEIIFLHQLQIHKNTHHFKQA